MMDGRTMLTELVETYSMRAKNLKKSKSELPDRDERRDIVDKYFDSLPPAMRQPDMKEQALCFLDDINSIQRVSKDPDKNESLWGYIIGGGVAGGISTAVVGGLLFSFPGALGGFFAGLFGGSFSGYGVGIYWQFNRPARKLVDNYARRIDRMEVYQLDGEEHAKDLLLEAAIKLPQEDPLQEKIMEYMGDYHPGEKRKLLKGKHRS